MNKTKQKIILAAISLFNKEGLVNVRNQDIAEAADISLSNFNYHFSTKHELVMAVCLYMTEVLEEKVYGNRILINEGQGLEITKSYFEFEQNFRFFYLDTHNILQTYPGLKELMRKQIKEAIQIIKNLNYMSIGMGLMKPEPEEMPGLYDKLAEQIWVSNHFWFAQMNIRGEDEVTIVKGLEASFALSYPYLTAKGIAAYRQFIDQVKETIQTAS